ncbi:MULTISPECIES: 3',5'-cyclic-AMP phosphodiesterase [Salinivibrio]|uniref:3',5'-cyclic-AMP phosphodiesterase n=1 Tax=Salinivibrio TaxID=51366 RepID=UPI000847E1EC|nr:MULTISPECIES: 3',5'-cyclic-AMP phosphodiesterase [Salinivibrio]ODP98392.1 3',5'-cyclic-AMP phosphodiesterase [Salinivibrio sp. BNH]OOE37552.1 3',5'-cyclic-AMP phosphodiesterase [Salinivibrio kushneri]OOE54472.1 3',5'-cyclic-AMP phosphodiesterase [Salinivibrio kushneri]
MQSCQIDNADGDCIRLLQITDTHLFASEQGSLLGINTLRSYHAVLDAISATDPTFDAIIATGDLSQDHSALSYRRFVDGIARWSQPCFWLPGNHDYQPEMSAVLQSNTLRSCSQVLLGEHWQMVLLDSQVAGVPHGELSQVQLNLLDTHLSAHPERHALVLLHHHPLDAGSTWLDQHKLANREAFWQVMVRHPQAKIVVCGHIHQALDVGYQGTRVMAAPSTCIQFMPDSHDFALDNQNPGWRWLELYDDGRVDTQVVRITGQHFRPDFDSSGY